MPRSLYITVMLLSLTLSAYAKDGGAVTGKGHSGDITRVLGIDLSRAGSYSKIEKLTSIFAEQIDSIADASNLLRQIQTVAPKFSWSKYTHRLFFHWGFNQDPRNSTKLNEQILAATEKPAEQEIIWRIILQEQGRRNSKMKDGVSKNLSSDGKAKASLTRKEINAIAAICYDTHILGDYIEGSEFAVQALVSLQWLLGDIINASRDLECSDYKILNDFKKHLNKAYHSSSDDTTRARAILECMIKDVPQIIKKSPRVKVALE
jgi:hypothetical protein